MTVGGYVYARPGVAEKGYLDAMLMLETSGGHSSRPPAHSGVGIIAEMKLPLSSTCEQISSEHLDRLFITLASTPSLTIYIGEADGGVSSLCFLPFSFSSLSLIHSFHSSQFPPSVFLLNLQLTRPRTPLFAFRSPAQKPAIPMRKFRNRPMDI